MTNLRETSDKATRFIKTNAKSIFTNLTVVLLAVVFVFYQTLKLEVSTLNPLTLFAESILAIVVGIMIKTSLGENGFDRAYRSEVWIRERNKYELKADAAQVFIDKVDTFYEKEHTEKLLKNRKTRLSGFRMKYTTFFDENGDYIEHEIWTPLQKKKWLKKNEELPEGVIVLDFRQRLCLFKCVRVRIHIKNMFSEYQIGLTADEKKEKTDRMQRAHNLRKNTFKTITFAITGVYFTVVMVWNIASIIWAIFQVLGFIVVGIIDAFDNYYYVTVEKVAILKEKQNDLARFLIENTSREEFSKTFVEQPKEEPKEIVVEVTPEQANALLKTTQQENKQ